MSNSNEMTLGEMVSELRGLEDSKHDPEMYQALLLRLLRAVAPKALIYAFLKSFKQDLPSSGKQDQIQLKAVILILEVLNDWTPTAFLFRDTLAALHEHLALPDMSMDWGCCSNKHVVSLGPTRETLAFLAKRYRYMQSRHDLYSIHHTYPDLAERMRFVTLEMLASESREYYHYSRPSDVGDSCGTLCERCGHVSVRRHRNEEAEERNRKLTAAINNVFSRQAEGNCPPF